ncbi:MAG TPA: aminotransferase class III-fold pyridoxal phosphate-dependent enzyme, partial [bacterium]|nr:aminotransferase class III-fold pyridoxal phosphate-dependent enzyme [bacterium]
MSNLKFTLTAKRLKNIETKYRCIKTPLPTIDYLKLFNKLSKYEARSMHGQLPIFWDKAIDSIVFDKNGNKWIDFTSTIFVANAGHGNKEIISEIKKYLDKPLLHTYTFVNEPRALFLEKLVTMSKSYFEKAFLLSAGTEATECAVKIMRMYGQKKRKDKVGIISFSGAMHGRTMGAQMLRGFDAQAEWIGFKDPNIFHLPFPYTWLSDEKSIDWSKKFDDDLNALIKNGMKIDKLCGIIIESYLGWGAIFYPIEYIQALYKFAKKNNLIVTFDEIQAGIGRTSKLFAFEHYKIKPDMVYL